MRKKTLKCKEMACYGRIGRGKRRPRVCDPLFIFAVEYGPGGVVLVPFVHRKGVRVRG